MCPFQVGDWIRYTPTQRGRGHLVMTDLANLIPNESYRIAEIVENGYIVLEGYESAVPDSIHWTEFTSDQRGQVLHSHIPLRFTALLAVNKSEIVGF